MALRDCTSLGYKYESSFCLPVSVDVKQDVFTHDNAWIAGAFFLGLVLGVGVILLLAILCLAAWRKKKQNEQNILLGTTKEVGVVDAQTANGLVNNGRKKKSQSVEKKSTFFKPQFMRRNRSRFELPVEEDVNGGLAHGMVDIMLKTSSSESEMKMAELDMAAIMSMERAIEEEKSTSMCHVLGILLRKKMKKRIITKNFFNNFMKKTEEDIKDLGKMIDIERGEDEEKLRNDRKLNKDTQTLETEMQKLHAHYNNRQSKLQRDFKNKIRQDLLRQSGMSEAEINDIMTKLMNNMAVVEKKIGLEQARQRRALDHRLARRKQVLEYMEIEANEAMEDSDTKVKSFANLLPAHMEGSHRIEKLLDDIVNDFANEVHGIRKYHAREYGELCKGKYDLLKNSRLSSFSKLVEKQDREKLDMLQDRGQITNTIDSIKRNHDLIVKHNMQREALCEELDRKEVEEIYKLKQDLSKQENKEMDILVEKTIEKIKNELNFEADKICELHKAEMKDFKVKRLKEKQAMFTRLQERLQQRLQIADENEAQDLKEQEIMREKQMAILNKVLNANMDLTEMDKDRILNEHEQNMQALSNQLLRSKLRQQKSLEIKLNQRKVNLEKLNQNRKDLQRSHEKAKDELLAKISADIAKEEGLFEVARQAAVTELRRQLANETEEALKLNDEEISLLTGRYQVSEARRKVILNKQDAALKILQEKLESKIASGEPSSEIDDIIKQHNSNVARLSDQLHLRKEKGEIIIKNRLSAKKRELKQITENLLDEHAQSEYTEQQRRGASYASQALMQLYQVQKHNKAMQELDAMMKAEMEKYQSNLHLELELELQKELQVEKQELLTEIAAVSKMSTNDVQDAFAAVTSGDIDNKVAQQLVKDIRDNVGKPDFKS